MLVGKRPFGVRESWWENGRLSVMRGGGGTAVLCDERWWGNGRFDQKVSIENGRLNTPTVEMENIQLWMNKGYWVFLPSPSK